MEPFDPQTAVRFADHAGLPMLYDEALTRGASHEEAKNRLSGFLEDNTDLRVVRQDDATAVITSSPKAGNINVSFYDTGSSTYVKFWGSEHPLGGEVYSGIYGTLMEDDGEGFFLDKVKDAVTELSETHTGSPDLNFSGFSKWGSMAIAAAGQWISEGLSETTGINIKNVYTFGSPPLGDEEFSKNFDQHCERLGVNVWRVTGGGNDPVPDMLTDEGSWYTRPFWPVYTKSWYTHVGNQKDLPEVEGHSLEAYKEAIENPGPASEQKAASAPEQEPVQETPSANSPSNEVKHVFPPCPDGP